MNLWKFVCKYTQKFFDINMIFFQAYFNTKTYESVMTKRVKITFFERWHKNS